MSSIKYVSVWMLVLALLGASVYRPLQARRRGCHSSNHSSNTHRRYSSGSGRTCCAEYYPVPYFCPYGPVYWEPLGFGGGYYPGYYPGIYSGFGYGPRFGFGFSFGL